MAHVGTAGQAILRILSAALPRRHGGARQAHAMHKGRCGRIRWARLSPKPTAFWTRVARPGRCALRGRPAVRSDQCGRGRRHRHRPPASGALRGRARSTRQGHQDGAQPGGRLGAGAEIGKLLAFLPGSLRLARSRRLRPGGEDHPPAGRPCRFGQGAWHGAGPDGRPAASPGQAARGRGLLPRCAQPGFGQQGSAGGPLPGTDRPGARHEERAAARQSRSVGANPHPVRRCPGRSATPAGPGDRPRAFAARAGRTALPRSHAHWIRPARGSATTSRSSWPGGAGSPKRSR